MEIDDEEHLNKKVKKSKKLNDSDEDLAGHSDEPELDMYDDEIDESAYGSEDDDMEDAVMSREQEKANKKLQKKELKNKLNNLDDIDDISSLIKKKPKKETE